MQKYAVRVRILATQEFRIPEKSRKNPGKTNKPSRTIPEDYWVYWKNPGRIPEKQTRPQNNPGRIPEDHCKRVKIKGDTIVMYNKPFAINGKWSILQENKNND